MWCTTISTSSSYTKKIWVINNQPILLALQSGYIVIVCIGWKKKIIKLHSIKHNEQCSETQQKYLTVNRMLSKLQTKEEEIEKEGRVDWWIYIPALQLEFLFSTSFGAIDLIEDTYGTSNTVKHWIHRLRYLVEHIIDWKTCVCIAGFC